MIFMVGKLRKKNIRQRGSKTHGWGSMKKHRGAGHRGGRGRAGSGKRGDAKKPTYQKAGKGYLGKSGFTSKSRNYVYPINLNLITTKLDKFAVEEKGRYAVNLKEHGYNKLLGTGKVNVKLEIMVDSASQKAVEKINAAGGRVIFFEQKTKQEKETKKPDKDKEKPESKKPKTK